MTSLVTQLEKPAYHLRRWEGRPPKSIKESWASQWKSPIYEWIVLCMIFIQLGSAFFASSVCRQPEIKPAEVVLHTCNLGSKGMYWACTVPTQSKPGISQPEAVQQTAYSSRCRCCTSFGKLQVCNDVGGCSIRDAPHPHTSYSSPLSPFRPTSDV